MTTCNIKYIETQSWSLGLLIQPSGSQPFRIGISFEPLMTMMAHHEGSAMALGLCLIPENRLGWRKRGRKVLVSQSCLISLQPHGLQPDRLLCPWDFQGKGTGVGCHSFLQGIFLIQESNLPPTLQADSLPSETPGKPQTEEEGERKEREKRGWIRKMCCRFLWGPVVRTLHFHGRGLGLDLWSGN